MIVILEGINGTGKSEVAKHIQSIHSDATIWRSFRPDTNTHWDHTNDEIAVRLLGAGVPLNTFVDDLYVADALRTLRPTQHVMLDRSMPSSVAYGLLKGEAWTKEHLDWVWQYWERLLREMGRDVVWIHLKAPYEVSRKRCDGRWHPNKREWEHLERTFNKLLNRTTIEVRVIQILNRSPQAIAEMVCQR